MPGLRVTQMATLDLYFLNGGGAAAIVEPCLKTVVGLLQYALRVL